jgi:hypothetical protein
VVYERTAATRELKTIVGTAVTESARLLGVGGCSHSVASGLGLVGIRRNVGADPSGYDIGVAETRECKIFGADFNPLNLQQTAFILGYLALSAATLTPAHRRRSHCSSSFAEFGDLILGTGHVAAAAVAIFDSAWRNQPSPRIGAIQCCCLAQILQKRSETTHELPPSSMLFVTGCGNGTAGIRDFVSQL